MIDSIRENYLNNNKEQAPSSATNFPEIETVKKIFNEVVSENPDTYSFEAFDPAIRAREFSLAREIMQKTMEKDWQQVQEACMQAKEIDQATPDLDASLKTFYTRGYVGHNNLLTRAIAISDYKAFIRTWMDGDDESWLTYQEPRNLNSLLHLAADSGQGEILYFLLLQGADVELKDKDGLTIQQAAEKNGRGGLSGFIDACRILIENQKNPSDELKEIIELMPPDLKKFLGVIVNSVEGYIGVYKEHQDTFISEDGKLTDAGKVKKDFAKHGLLIRHDSQGHNGLVIESIVKGDLEKLAAYVKMGASIDTLSINWQKALKDPHAFGQAYMDFVNESMRTFLQDTRETFLGEDQTLWDKNLGVGKTLLDLAVLYSNEKQDNLAIMAYLIGKGLDPFRTNDEGESPFSIALSKGNLKAAMLMMSYKRVSEGRAPNIDEETLNKVFLILKEGAQMRDPLYVNSSKTRSGIFAAAYLLTHLHIQDELNGLLSWINFFSFFHTNFMSDELTFREKLNVKSERSLYLPDLIWKIYPAAYKASVLEYAIRPDYPVGSLVTTAIGVYAGAMSTLSSLKTAYNYVVERPLSAMYKVGMDVLSTAKSAMIFKYYFSSLVYNPMQHWMSPVDTSDYHSTNILQRLESSKLDPRYREHAKLIFTDKWNQTAFENNQFDYLKGFVANVSNSLNFFHTFKLDVAKETLESPSFLRDTVVKGGMIFAANLVHFESWQPLQKASIFYNVAPHLWQKVFGEAKR